MILRNKRDTEAWARELTVETMKQNQYLEENDFVEISSTGFFYKIVTKRTDIQLANNLYAELQPFLKASKDEYGLVKIGNGLNITDGVVSHPDKHLPGEIATDENNRFVTDAQINNWNDKVSNQTFQSAIDEIVDKAIKGASWKPPVPTYDDIATTYPDPKDTWTTVTMDTNMIYMYDAENREWRELGAMLVPNLNFNETLPCINEVGGISKGTTFDNIPILQLLHDMLYKKIDRDKIPEFYYGLLDNPNDFDFSKYSKKQYIKFPLKLSINDINLKYINFVFKPTMESGIEINPTDMFIQRVSEEVKNAFGLDTDIIDLEQVFDFKITSIRGTNYMVISSKKVLSGSYDFIINFDKNRTFTLTQNLLNKVNELESTIYRTKLQVEGGV